MNYKDVDKDSSFIRKVTANRRGWKTGTSTDEGNITFESQLESLRVSKC